MGKKCFISNCKSGYPSCKEKVCIFGAPKDEKTLQKWREVIPRKDRLFSIKDSVCAKHFQEEDILKEWTDGFNHIPHKYFRLKEGAYPTLFSNYPNYLNINEPEKTTIKTETVDSDYITDPLFVGITENNFIDDSTSTDIHSKVPTTSSSLFHAIMNDEISVMMPNKLWSVSKITNKSEPCIVFLKLIFSNNAVPVIEKQLVIAESLIIRVFIHGLLISNINHTIISHNDISEILERLENLNVCRGLKGNENVSKNVQKRKIAIVDHCNILRHKNCTITTASDVEICIYCMSSNLQLRDAYKKNQSKIVGSKLRNIQNLNIRLRERLNRYERIIKYTRHNLKN